MISRGWNRSDLAREAKTDKSTISRLLGGKISQSPVVPRIEKKLDMRARTPKGELWRQIDDVVADLDDGARARLLERAIVLREELRRR